MLSESSRCPAQSDQLVPPFMGQPRCSSSEQSVASLRIPGKCPTSSDSALTTFPLGRNAFWGGLGSWAPLGPSAGKNGCFGSDCSSAPCRRAAVKRRWCDKLLTCWWGRQAMGHLGSRMLRGYLQGLLLALAPTLSLCCARPLSHQPGAGSAAQRQSLSFSFQPIELLWQPACLGLRLTLGKWQPTLHVHLGLQPPPGCSATCPRYHYGNSCLQARPREGQAGQPPITLWSDGAGGPGNHFQTCRQPRGDWEQTAWLCRGEILPDQPGSLLRPSALVSEGRAIDFVYLDSARLSKASPITPSLTRDKWKVRLTELVDSKAVVSPAGLL